MAQGSKKNKSRKNSAYNSNDGDVIIFGGIRYDILTGGAGSDVFVFESGFDDDIITDFSVSEDRIKFEGLSANEVSRIRIDGNVLSIGSETIQIDGIEGRDYRQTVVADGSEHDVTIDFSLVNLTDTLENVSASQSNNWSNTSWTADWAIDNSITTINHQGSKNNAWLSVDLGEDADIGRVVIENRQDQWSSRLDGATLEVLNNGVTVKSHTLNGDYTQTIDFSAAVGDQVKIKSTTGDYVHIAEIDIFGTAKETINLGQDAELELVEIVNSHVSSRLNGATLKVFDDDALVFSQVLTGDVNQSIETFGQVSDHVVGDRVRIDNPNGDYVHLNEIDPEEEDILT